MTVTESRRWLREQVSPHVLASLKDRPQALAILPRELESLRHNRRLILADTDSSLVIALVNSPGSLYDTLRLVREREISFAMMAHSEGPLPGRDETLELQRFDFGLKSNAEIAAGRGVTVPAGIRRRIAATLRQHYPSFDHRDLERLLRLLWLNNEQYVRQATSLRLAQVLNLFQQGNRSGGLHLDVEPMESGCETRVHFAVGNPPQRDFLLQVMEVFKRLELGVNRAYCLTVSNGVHPYFLGSFYVRCHDGGTVERGSELFHRLRQELYTTQVVATGSQAYREFVTAGLMSGEEAALVNAFIAFCHTSLAHAQPERFGLEDVRGAFHGNPDMALLLVQLLQTRFDPELPDRPARYEVLRARTEQAVAEYNTGHRYLDDLRRTVFRCCLLFISHTLKTNLFVPEKQALAFRLDPAYLAELGNDFTADLPPALPFRVTFFFSRFGFGYHIGFSDIARGGWRTVIARSPDDFATGADTLFRETFVLAHTQHFKNKDIYEGGSKLVVLLDASDLRRERERDQETWRLFKLQYGIANAFLDIFVTRDGKASHPALVDYYGEDEPIELGPDENMQDSMIEAIAQLSRRRGYLLGIGIMSSKRVGINHKEYGVTSTGVVKFAEITMAELGVDIRRDPFSVKLTGGPNGDVAGNALRILLERSPGVRVVLILDGTAALVDLQGADRDELGRILLKEDLHAFDPARLSVGGFMLFRSNSRREGLRELFRTVTMTGGGLLEEWISLDDFSRQYGELPFTVPADLFIPAGGRPETIDGNNWQQFLAADGTPSARAIVEGANSFITPEARLSLQQRGIIIMRDASANKCGVISSSYEILANLLLSDEEFLEQKERYVADVLAILERRAEDEARLILRRRRQQPGLLCTEISDSLSSEINALYARLFRLFQEQPDLCHQPLFRRAILAHLPAMIGQDPRLRRRISRLPAKYQAAILAAEIGSSLVYRGDQEEAFMDLVKLHLAKTGARR
jgi:glutamate dehydrogenase